MDNSTPNESQLQQSAASGSPAANPAVTPQQQADDQQKAMEQQKADSTIVIHMWPKTLVFYPVALFALIFAVVGYFFGAYPAEKEIKNIVLERATALKEGTDKDRTDPQEMIQLAERLVKGQQVDKVMGWIFFIVLAGALFALCIDTEIRWALIWFAGSIAVILALMLLNNQFRFLPEFLGRILQFDPAAKPQFYAGITAVWLILYVLSLFIIRFHCVKIERNEVFVMYGLLEGQRRFSTLQMKYEKDVTDVLEYYLPFVRAGKLVLSFPGQEKIILDNVRDIDKVIARLNGLTSQFNVGVPGMPG